MNCTGCKNRMTNYDTTFGCSVFPHSRNILNCPCMSCLIKMKCEKKANCPILKEDYISGKIENISHVCAFELYFRFNFKLPVNLVKNE